MDSDKWIRRYKTRWLKRVPDVSDDRLGDEEMARAYVTYTRSLLYQQDPEAAVDDLINFWVAEGAALEAQHIGPTERCAPATS